MLIKEPFIHPCLTRNKFLWGKNFSPDKPAELSGLRVTKKTHNFLLNTISQHWLSFDQNSIFGIRRAVNAWGEHSWGIANVLDHLCVTTLPPRPSNAATLNWPSEEVGKVCKKPTKLVTHPKTQHLALALLQILWVVKVETCPKTTYGSKAHVEKQRKTEYAAHNFEW